MLKAGGLFGGLMMALPNIVPPPLEGTPIQVRRMKEPTEWWHHIFPQAEMIDIDPQTGQPPVG